MHGSAQPEKDLEAAAPFSNHHANPATDTSAPEGNEAVKARTNRTSEGNGSDSLSSDPRGSGSRSSDLRSLEERELESTLQLLVERAQYITGATGAALALPQDDEMVCRASAGTSAPAVGARLQVKSGLTGESMLRHQLLRCDNAETDPRVNLEACRALGIASIVVLPLVRQGGEVRGLFELFSDHPYAFEERDLIALERMAALTQTALDLAEKAMAETKQTVNAETTLGPSETESDDDILDVASDSSVPVQSESPATILATTADAKSQSDPESLSRPSGDNASVIGGEISVAAEPLEISSETDEATSNSAIEDQKLTELADPKPESRRENLPLPTLGEPITIANSVSETVLSPIAETTAVKSESASNVEESSKEEKAPDAKPADLINPIATAATEGALDHRKTADQPTPAAMLKVQKCATCGFPVSEGRTLCLDCENKEQHEKSTNKLHVKDSQVPLPHEIKSVATVGSASASDKLSETSPSTSDAEQFVPAFLANSVPVKESWLSDHVNLLAILVFIMCILVAIVIFR